MFQAFYKWLTYNPHGIDFKEIVPSISVIVFMIAISCTALLWSSRGEVSLKTIAEGILMAGYIFFAMLWSRASMIVNWRWSCFQYTRL